MPGPYSMIGYRNGTSHHPFLEEGVTTDSAKEHATARGLERFLLLPHHPPYQHRAYIRRGQGVYEQMDTRLFVFSHLLTPGNDRTPTAAEVRSGRWLPNG